MPKKIEVHVVFFQEEGTWVAQCVEYDIAAFASTLAALPRAFERAVAANVCANADMHRDPLTGIPKAPSRYRDMFEQAVWGPRGHRPPIHFDGHIPFKVGAVHLADAA